MNQRKQDTQAYFDEIGRQYGALYEPNATLAVYPSGPMREQKALRLIQQFKPHGTVLDCGCGTGHFACALARLGYEVAGIDLSQTMIEQSRAGATEISAAHPPRFSVGDCEKLDVPDRSLDAITSLGVIEYLTSDDAMIAQIARVLKPDGIAVIAFRNRLFNLFSANRYTQAEIEAGTIGQVLAEYQSEAASFGNGSPPPTPGLRYSEDPDQPAKDPALTSTSEPASAEGVQNKKPTVRAMREVAPGPYSEFARVMAQQSTLAAAESGRAAGVASPIPRPVPIALRQHTPAGARAAMAAAGFECERLLYFHFHPFPPGYERIDAQVFNRLGIAMESLDDTPIGAMMASAFVAAFRRK